MTALAIDQQIDNHGRSAGTLLAGGGCRGYRPAGEVTDQDRPTLRGRAGFFHRLSHVFSPLRPAGRTCHGFPGHFPFQVTLAFPPVGLERHRPIVRSLRGRSAYKFRGAIRSGIRTQLIGFRDHSPCRDTDLRKAPHVERLSCAAVYGPNHSEAPVHATGSFTQGLGNV